MSRSFARAAVVGTGQMGPGIALCLAAGGVRTTLLARSEESAARALTAARDQAATLTAHGLLDADPLPRIDASTGWAEPLAEADFVIESTPEQMSFKQDLFAQLESQVREDAVLASNTSGLSITQIASKCRRPERILTTHFWNPPHLMALVEIVLGERTDRAVADAVRVLLAQCGKAPVLVEKDTPGQLGNRLQMALVREAAHIVAEGIATPEAVDTAARMGFGLRMPAYGILEHQDMVGLDMTLGIMNYVGSDLNSHPGAGPLHHALVAAGKLGVKSGQGFYAWTPERAQQVRDRRDAFLLQMLAWKKQRES
jgi:3-hydroxybutyryl-CoA dehydrogenase